MDIDPALVALLPVDTTILPLSALAAPLPMCMIPVPSTSEAVDIFVVISTRPLVPNALRPLLRSNDPSSSLAESVDPATTVRDAPEPSSPDPARTITSPPDPDDEAPLFMSNPPLEPDFD